MYSVCPPLLENPMFRPERSREDMDGRAALATTWSAVPVTGLTAVLLKVMVVDPTAPFSYWYSTLEELE